MCNCADAHNQQGLCRYLEKAFPDGKQRGVVVGFDGRHNSVEFAHATAATFISRGFKVYLFSEMCPTPFVVRVCVASVFVCIRC